MLHVLVHEGVFIALKQLVTVVLPSEELLANAMCTYL